MKYAIIDASKIVFDLSGQTGQIIKVKFGTVFQVIYFSDRRFKTNKVLQKLNHEVKKCKTFNPLNNFCDN